MIRSPMTAEGHAALDQELKHLKAVERPAIIQAISVAREHGDLSENAEYHAAKEKQSFIEGRIVELEDKLSRADVMFGNASLVDGAFGEYCLCCSSIPTRIISAFLIWIRSKMCALEVSSLYEAHYNL